MMYSSSDEFVNLQPFIGNAIPQNAPWLPYNSDHFVGSRCGGSDDVNCCISLTRIAIILSYYKEWLQERIAICDLKDDNKSMYDFINKVFDAENGYSNSQLLDDYHHLIENHSHQFEDIYTRIIKQSKHKDDDIKTSYFMQRNYRNKGAFDREQYNTLYFATDSKQRCIQQLLDTICCYFLYSYAVGYIANDAIQNEIKAHSRDLEEKKEEEEDDDDKRPSHVRGLVFKSFGRASLSKQARYKKHKQVQEMLNMFAWIKSNRNKLKDMLPKQVYHAIYQTQNRFMSVARHKCDEKTQQFGYRLYYWIHYEQNNAADEFNVGYKYKDFYVKAVHKSLKEEALNSTYKIDINQWKDLYEKANCYLSCAITKKMKVEAAANKYIDINMKEAALITIDHLLSIFLYTNYPHIEYEVSAACRKKSRFETNSALKVRNSHLAILSRFLSETVRCFGNKAVFNKRLEYFHVINKSIVIPSSIKYNAALSTSTSKMVAINMLHSYKDKKEEGLLLEISARETKQFDCKFFSDNTNECEMLLFQCNAAITVQNVINVELGVNYHIYLYAFRIITAMLDGSDLNKKQRGMHFKVSDIKSVTPIYKFLYHKFYGKKNEFVVESVPIYVEQILNSYFDKLTQIQISWSEMRKISSKINGFGDKNTFNMKILSIIQPFLCYYHIQWIKWHLMIHAFPKLKSITIHSIKLSKDIFEDVLFHIQSMNNQQLEEIIFRSPNSSKLGFSQIKEQFSERFAKFNWKISKTNNHKIVIHLAN